MCDSDTCEADGRRRADETVTILGSDAHSVGVDLLAASILFGGQSPELSSFLFSPPSGQSIGGKWDTVSVGQTVEDQGGFSFRGLVDSVPQPRSLGRLAPYLVPRFLRTRV